MGLHRSPLFAATGAAGASFGEVSGWVVPEHYGDVGRECATLRSGAGLLDYGSRGVVTLTGPDARRFCNGMFTNNVRNLPVGSGNANAMVDDKARLQGLLELLCVAEGSFVALLDGVSPEAFSERYAKYIIFDDVELEDVSEERGLLGVQGPATAAVLQAAGLPFPEAEGRHVTVSSDLLGKDALGEVTVYRRARCPAGGVEILSRREALPTLWEALRGAGAAPVGFQAQEVLRIEAGQVRWPVDMGEKALAHEMRMVPRYCHFEKGCYIGQEVINRIDVMGQVQKKIWGLTMGEDAIPPLGAEVKLGEQVVGTLASGAREPRGEGSRVRCLAVLRKAAWTPGLQVEVHAGGRVVPATVSDLPFES